MGGRKPNITIEFRIMGDGTVAAEIPEHLTPWLANAETFKESLQCPIKMKALVGKIYKGSRILETTRFDILMCLRKGFWE